MLLAFVPSHFETSLYTALKSTPRPATKTEFDSGSGFVLVWVVSVKVFPSEDIRRSIVISNSIMAALVCGRNSERVTILSPLQMVFDFVWGGRSDSEPGLAVIHAVVGFVSPRPSVK